MVQQSLFDTISLKQVAVNLNFPETILRDNFFSKKETFDTKDVQLDVKTEEKLLSNFVHTDARAHEASRDAVEKKTFTPPTVKETLNTKASDIVANAALGEPIGIDPDAKQKSIDLITEDMFTLRNRNDRLLEWMAAELMTDGSVTISGEGFADYDLDFGMPAGNQVVLAGAAQWDQSTATPLRDLRNLSTTVSQASGLMPNVFVFGKNAMNLFLEHADVLAYLDSRRAIVIAVETVRPSRGLVNIGNFDAHATMIAHVDNYKDSAGSMQQFVNEDMVLVGSTDAATLQAYGAIQDYEANFARSEWFFKSFLKDNPSVRKLLFQSHPLLALTQSAAFGTLTVA